MPSSATSRPAHGFGSCCLNIVGAKYTFSGAPTHQMTPWNGRNALTAMNLFFGNIDAVRPRFARRRGFRATSSRAVRRPTSCRIGSVADFYIRYPDEVYLAQVVEFVDNAAKAAALATGTKVKIDHYGKALDGIGLATLAEVGFAVHEELRRHRRQPGTGQAAGLRRDRQRVARHPRHRHQRAVVNVLEPHLRDGRRQPQGRSDTRASTIDAQTMAALLFDFATRADYRAAVKKEFDGIKLLFGEYRKR